MAFFLQLMALLCVDYISKAILSRSIEISYYFLDFNSVIQKSEIVHILQ